MNHEIIEKELGDCLELVIDHRGKTPKKLGADWIQAGIPTISAKNVNGGRLVSTDSIRHVSFDIYKKWMKVDVKREDCFLVSEGATLGECMLWDYDHPIVLGQRIFCLRANPAILYPRYLYAYMTSNGFQSEIIGRATGTSVDGLRQTEVLKLKIKLPPLNQQRQIGDVLYYLNKKIELNRQMNATLEAMARALFQSWFVDFDPVRAKLDGGNPAGLGKDTADLFPKHFQASVVGPIPHGWRVGVLNDLTELVIGGDWGSTEPTDDETLPTLCIRGADIPSLQEGGIGKMPTRFLKPSSLEKRRLVSGDLAVEISGGSPTQSTGRPVLVSEVMIERLEYPLVCSNFCRVLKLKASATSKFAYLWLRRLYDGGEFFQFENGTTGIKNLAFTLFAGKYPMVIPPLELCEAFDRAVSPLFQRHQKNGIQSRTLAALRDALLPKLLSGEISVFSSDAVQKKTRIQV